MGKIFINLPLMTATDVSTDDRVAIEDVSLPKTKSMTIAELSKAVSKHSYPIGSLYFNADDATNPSVLLGFGIWQEFAQGQVPVGKATSGTFSTAGTSVGQETTRHAAPYWGINNSNFQQSGAAYLTSVVSDMNNYLTGGGSSAIERSMVVRSLGGSVGNNTGNGIEVSHLRYTAPNIQPSIVVYIWKRIA